MPLDDEGDEVDISVNLQSLKSFAQQFYTEVDGHLIVVQLDDRTPIGNY